MDASIDSMSSNVNVVFTKLNVCFNDESFASNLKRIIFKLNKKIYRIRPCVVLQ